MKPFKLITFSVVAFLSFLSLYLIVGCGGRKDFTPPKSTDKTLSVKEIVRDTVFLTRPDSSALKALVECQNGKAVIKEIINSEPGKNNLQPPKAQLEDNILTVDCEAKAQELFATWKERYKEETTTVTNTEYINVLTGWQTFFIFVGKIMIFLFIGVIIAHLIELGIKKRK